MEFTDFYERLKNCPNFMWMVHVDWNELLLRASYIESKIAVSQEFRQMGKEYDIF